MGGFSDQWTYQQAIPFAVIALAKVMLMCGIGTLLSMTKVNVLTADARILLSKLVFLLFLPCLIFTQLGDVLTTSKMLNWWFIPANVLISTALGFFVGYLVALICRPPKEFFRFTIVMTGMANIGNIPLGIILSLCRDKKNPFGPPHLCNKLGVAHQSFASWVGACLVYTLVYHLMAPYEDHEAITPATGTLHVSHHRNALLHIDGVEESGDTTPAGTPLPEDKPEDARGTGLLKRLASIPAVLWTDWPPLDEARTQHGGQLVLPLLGNNPTRHRGDSDLETPVCLPCMAEPAVIKKMRVIAEQTPLQHLLQPPILASVLAIIVGSIPQLKAIVFGEQAPLLFITDSLGIIGNAMVPCILLVLGGNFIRSTGSSRLGLRTTIGITFARLVVMPVIGMGVVLLADRFGWIPGKDKSLFRFVLLLQNTMPTSLLTASMSSLRGYGENEASSLMFFQHTVGIIPIAFFLSLYMQMST